VKKTVIPEYIDLNGHRYKVNISPTDVSADFGTCDTNLQEINVYARNPEVQAATLGHEIMHAIEATGSLGDLFGEAKHDQLDQIGQQWVRFIRDNPAWCEWIRKQFKA